MIHIKIIFIYTFLLFKIRKAVKSLELSFNPYKYYDDRNSEWRVIEVNETKKELLYRAQKYSYSAFKEEQKTVLIDNYLNDSSNIKSKLPAKLLYFLTNQYNPVSFEEKDFKMESPFIITKENKDLLMNLELTQYESKEISVNLSIKDKIKKAEIVDLFADTAELVPMMCSESTQIQQSEGNCSSLNLKTDDPMDSIPLKFRFIPNKVGKHKYNLYVLAVINDKFNIIVTVNGNYNVKKNLEFELYYSRDLFRIGLDKNNYDYLWLKNLKNKTANVASLQGYGINLKLNYPKKFKQSEFASLSINSKLRQRIKNSNNNYWLVPSADERPIIEIEFSHSSKEFHKETPIPLEIFRSKLQNNILRIIADQKYLVMSLSIYFAPDYRFWDHDFINCGVITSKEVWHEVPIYAASKTPLPMYLHNVEIDLPDKDFQVYMASQYKYGIPYPFENQKMKLFNLLIRYTGNEKFAVFNGKIKATIDIFNSSFEETLNFYGVYYKELFSITTKTEYNLVKPGQDKFSIYLTQNTNSIFKLDQIKLNEDKYFEDKVTFMGYVLESLRPGVEYKLYDVDFSELWLLSEPLTYTKASYNIKIKALENIFSFNIEFPIQTILCTTLSNFTDTDFKECTKNEKLVFPLFTKYRNSLKKEIFFKNPNLGQFDLHKIKARNFNMDFQNILHIKHVPKNRPINEMNEEMNYSYQINRPITIMFPSIKIEEGDIVKIVVEITMPTINEKKLHPYLPQLAEREVHKYNSTLVFSSKDPNKDILFNVEYEYNYGYFSITPLEYVGVNVLFPTGIKNLVIYGDSSYEKPVILEIPRKAGVSKDIFELRTFNRFVKMGEKYPIIMEFKLDPSLLKNFDSSQNLPKSECLKDICYGDLLNYFSNQKILENLEKSSNLNINTTIIIQNSIKDPVEVSITGKIIKASFTETSLDYIDLGYVSNKYQSKHDIVLQNPFDENVEIQLYIIPKTFLNKELIENEIKEKIKSLEEKKKTTICMKNDHMPFETLQYYAHRIYSKNLEFIKDLKPRNHPNGAKFACFQSPRNDTETDMILFKIQTFNNYFFEFIQDRDKSNIVKKELFYLSDFDSYNFFKPKVSKINNEGYNFGNIKNVIYEYLFGNNKKIVKKPKAQISDFYKINHVKDIKNYNKTKELFINSRYLNMKFVVPPQSRLVIKDALIMDPLLKDLDDEMKINDSYLIMIKNNITKFDMKEIKFKKFKPFLKPYDAGYKPLINNNDCKTIPFKVFPANSKIYIKKNNNEFEYSDLIQNHYRFINKGKKNMFIKKVEILNDGRNEKCLDIINFEPKIIKVNKDLLLQIVFFPCKKMLRNFDVLLRIHEEEEVWEYTLNIIFENYIIKNLEYNDQYEKILITFIFVGLGNIYWFLSSYLKQTKKKRNYSVTEKVYTPKLIAESTLEEKLKIHKAEITLKTIKILQKENRSLTKTVRKNSEFENTKEFDFNTGILSKILSGNKEVLKNYDYNKNVFTTIPNNLPLDMSGISIEKIYKLLENPKSRSDSEENISQKFNLINNTDVYQKDDSSFNQKFGSIGDNSFSGLQGSINQELSPSKKTVSKQANTNFTPNQFINSFIISQKFKDDSNIFDEEDISEENQEDNQYQKDSNFIDIDNAFGFYPLGKKKQTNKISVNSKEYVKPSRLIKKILEKNNQRRNSDC